MPRTKSVWTSIAIRRLTCGLLVVTTLLCLRAAEAADDGFHPNVVLIMTDDQGWGDIHSHGNAIISTPTLDRMAEEGARFERFYVSPVCAPTRSSLLTGRYHLRTGTHGVTRGMENMRSEEVTIAEAFKQAGYATGCFGKWHNGRHYPYHPNGQGFDEFVGFCAGHWNNYFDATLEHNGEYFQSDGYITDTLTDYALEFIENHKTDRFFCYVPYNAPHSPWQVPDEYWDNYTDQGLSPETQCAYAMVENIDENVGRILQKLDELQLDESTIVLFLTDNGPNGNRYNGNMRGRKGSVHEGGVRVPLFMRWTGHITPETVVEEIAMHIDLLPTLVELAGIDMPETLPLDGRSLAPLLSRLQEPEWPDRILYTHRYRGGPIDNVRGAARSQRYRAVIENAKRGWQLYDMVVDPDQTTDIAEQHPEVLNELVSASTATLADILPSPMEPLRIPVGHPERSIVDLPGHEAFLHPAKGEGISYHGPNGWANDWIDNWTDTSAYPQWNLIVERPGNYEVSIGYAVSEDDVGATIEVQAQGESAQAEITEPHDGPFLPMHDRIGRKEAPDRVWKHMTVGTLPLQAGEAELTLRAVSKPGEEVAEIKEVRLRRLGD